MSTQYTRFYDQMESVIDSIAHDSDPSQRLNNLQRIQKDGMKAMLRARDEAAYDLRCKYSSEDASAVSGIDRKYIDYWATRWRKKNMLPPLRKKRRIDLSNALDLSGK